MRSRGANIVVVALTAVLAVCPFLPALEGTFLGWDDRRALIDFDGWRSGDWLASIRWAFTSLDMGMYRPLTWLSYRLDFALSGLEPSAFHRTNLVVHALVAGLAVAALRRWIVVARLELDERWAALMALAFAVHPLRVQVVAWVSARADALAAAFLLVAVLAWLRFVETRSVGARIAWHVAFGFSLLCKPIALAGAFVFFVAGWWLARRRPELRGPSFIDAAIGAAMAVLISLPLALAKGVVHTVGGLPELPASAAFTALHNSVQPLWKLLWPMSLGIAEPAWPFEPFEVAYVLGALVAVALGAFIWSMRARAPGLAVTALAWLALMGPMLGVVPFGYELTADRFSYLPSLALLPGALWLMSRVQRRQWFALAVPVLVFWSVLAWQHTGVWQTSEKLWRYTLAQNPRSALALTGLGDDLLKQNRVAEGEALYLRAIEWLPPYEPTLLGLGFADLAQGRPHAAIPKLDRYIQTHPENRAARRFFDAAEDARDEMDAKRAQ